MANGDVRVWGATNVGGFPAWSGWSSQSLRARTTMFCFHPATRLTRQSWYTSLRVIQPCLLAEKIQTFAVRKWGKRRKGKGSRIWRFAVCDFWAGHLVGGFYLTLPYQIAGRSSHRSFCMIYDVIEWDMVIMVWYGMVGYAMESATDGRDRFLMVISRKRWDVWWWWRSREVFFCTVSNAINWLRKPPRLSILAIFFANVFFLNKQLRYFTRTRGVFREARLKKNT